MGILQRNNKREKGVGCKYRDLKDANATLFSRVTYIERRTYEEREVVLQGLLTPRDWKLSVSSPSTIYKRITLYSISCVDTQIFRSTAQMTL